MLSYLVLFQAVSSTFASVGGLYSGPKIFQSFAFMTSCLGGNFILIARYTCLLPLHTPCSTSRQCFDKVLLRIRSGSYFNNPGEFFTPVQLAGMIITIRL